MIQRIQTIWLFVAAICVFLTFKLPFFTGTHPKLINGVYELNGMENFMLILFTLLTGLLAGIIIFLYKNRTLQLRLCVLGILLEAVLIFLYYNQTKTFSSGTYALWAILHSIVLVCFFLAARAINKDERLIKESDRLR
jgi:peptidoglycan/LPS O-acetylase OafA/YrhL